MPPRGLPLSSVTVSKAPSSLGSRSTWAPMAPCELCGNCTMTPFSPGGPGTT